MGLIGASYYPEQRDPHRWAEDLDRMQATGITRLRVAEFAWTRFEPQDGRFAFDWLDRFLDLAHARGIEIMLCPPLRTAPIWLVEQAPDILIEKEDGVRLEFGSRYTFCINHPLFIEKGFRLARALAERYGKHPAVTAWHIDNEYGDEPDCHCPYCKDTWQAWLKNRYGTIEALNTAWGTVFWNLTFAAFAQVPTPRITKAFHNNGLLQAWRQFRSDCTVRTAAAHTAAIRPFIGDRPVTTNVQCLWNARTDYADFGAALDEAGINYYPPYGENCRSNALGLAVCRAMKQRDFNLLELRSGPHHSPGFPNNNPDPGAIDRLITHVIAHGARTAYFYRWKAVPFGPEQNHGSITDFDGQPTRVTAEIAEASRRAARLDPLLKNSRINSPVAVLYDFPTRWFMERSYSWGGPPEIYLSMSRGMFNALRGQGINVDVVYARQDFAPYRVLVIPAFCGMTDELAEKLHAFVRDGGILVTHPFTGVHNAEGAIFPTRVHDGLSKLLGLDLREFATFNASQPCRFEWRGQSYPGQWFCDLPVLTGAEAQGTFAKGWYAGMPAVTRRRIGKGTALHIATWGEDTFYRALAAALLEEAGVRPIADGLVELPGTVRNHSDATAGNTPAGPAERGESAVQDSTRTPVEVSERTCADGSRLVFLMNATALPQGIRFLQRCHDVWNDEPVDSLCELAPWQTRILHVEP